MIKLVVTAHGEFANGIVSSLNLIAGPQEELEVVNFVEGMSAATLRDEIDKATLGSDEVLILCDLLGGTPFNISCEVATASSEQTIVVLSGLNLAMLLDATFSRLNYDFDDLVAKLVLTAKEAVVDSKTLLSTTDEEQSDIEDGI